LHEQAADYSSRSQELLVTREEWVVGCQYVHQALPGAPRRAAMMVLLFGAKGPAPRQPVNVTGSLQAASDLNPSVTQRPSPLTLRIYELKSSVAFDQADFMTLYRSDQTALGADVLAREEVTLQPGESKPYNKLLNAETRFIAVFGAYRNLEKSTWRAIAAVPNGSSKQKLAIRADALAVSVQVSP
jgi:type VI secretion system protein VasD